MFPPFGAANQGFGRRYGHCLVVSDVFPNDTTNLTGVILSFPHSQFRAKVWLALDGQNALKSLILRCWPSRRLCRLDTNFVEDNYAWI